MKNKIMAPALVLGAVAISGMIWAGSASAGFGQGNMNSSLAQKLGIEESKVSDAMDQIHTEKKAEMEKLREEKLAKAVTDGVISAEQKDQLTAKQKAFRDEAEKNRLAHREEMQKWFSEQNIDETKLKEYMGGGNGMGHGQGRMMR